MTPSWPAASASSSTRRATPGSSVIAPGMRQGPATRSSAASRSVSGTSTRSVPSTCRMSKNRDSRPGIPAAPAPSCRPNWLIVSWNMRGSSSSPTPMASPSSTRLSAGSDRASSAMPGRRAVTSLRLRVKIRTSSPTLCTWMRAPSSFHSTDASVPTVSPVPSPPPAASLPLLPATSAKASATSVAVWANIGWTGRSSVSPTAASPASPSVSAISATAGRSPPSIAARRIVSRGTPAALATASVTSPSNAPWRSSPTSRRRSRSCSGAVAAPSSARSSAARAACEPGPLRPAGRSSGASTSAISSCGSSAGSASMPATVRQPTPMRPCRGVPVRIATTTGTSPGASRPNSSASAAALRDRARVEATSAVVATTSANRTAPSCRLADLRSWVPRSGGRGHRFHIRNSLPRPSIEENLWPRVVSEAGVAGATRVGRLGGRQVRLVAPPAGVKDQPRHGAEERDQAHPDVPADADQERRRVDPQRLDPGASQRVAGDVEGEQPTGATAGVASLPPDEQSRQGQVPQRLVQERRVERLGVEVSRRTVVGVDLQAPRQAGGTAEELLVEPVAQTADGLGNGERWGDHVEQLGDRKPAAVGDVGADTHARDEPARDAEPALPHREGVEPAALVPVMVGDDVVEPGADQPGEDRPHGEAADVVGVATPGGPAAAGDPDRGQHAQRDGEAVGPELERSQLDGVVGRAGDGEQNRHGTRWCSAWSGASLRAAGGWRPAGTATETLPPWTSRR